MSAEAEVVEAEVVPDEGQPGQDSEEVAQELVPHSPTQGDVMVPLDSEQLVDSFRAYQELRGKLLNAEDYQAAGRGKQFVKKSGWRKIATAFGLNLEIVKGGIERDDEGGPARAEVWARAIAPNGRFADGDGYCDVSEERFSGPRGNRSKLENDLRATATTRAMNRAISNLVGMGEVSAEEVGGDAPATGPKFGPVATDQQIDAMKKAIAYLFGQLDELDPTSLEEQDLIGKITDSYEGSIPQASAGSIILLAKQIHAALAARQPKED